MSLVKSIFNFLRFNKKNWKAVALCIFAATVFWFFNALNKNYSTNISFPVSFDYDQEHFIATRTLPATVRMNVNGSGWDLFRRSLGFKVPPLVVPLEKPAEVKKIVGTTLPAIFAGQLERLKINFVITDTVRLDIEERIRKKFNVKLDSVSRNLHPDFGITSEKTLLPDTVWLEGPKKVISKLSNPLLITLPQTGIRKNFNEAIELTSTEHTNLITAEPQKVMVSFEVEQFELAERQVPLTILNIPAKLKSTGILKTVSCTYRLPVSVAKTFSGDSLRAKINLKNKSRGTHKLVAEITGLPEHATLIKTDTVLINF